MAAGLMLYDAARIVGIVHLAACHDCAETIATRIADTFVQRRIEHKDASNHMRWSTLRKRRTYLRRIIHGTRPVGGQTRVAVGDNGMELGLAPVVDILYAAVVGERYAAVYIEIFPIGGIRLHAEEILHLLSHSGEHLPRRYISRVVAVADEKQIYAASFRSRLKGHITVLLMLIVILSNGH